MNKNKQSLREMWDTVKYTNICIIRIPAREKKEKRTEKNVLKKYWLKSHQILLNNQNLHIQEA